MWVVSTLMRRWYIPSAQQGNREGLPLARRPAVGPSPPLPCGGARDSG
ncbi:MAG TPA: hypothetical protein VKY19_05745 [Ktedonosporobacter sp.]|nr:hypothetical protein [Ktedonosporobacter sp.]